MGRRVKGQFVITGHSYLVWLLSSGSPVLPSSDWECNEIALFRLLLHRNTGAGFVVLRTTLLVLLLLFYRLYWQKRMIYLAANDGHIAGSLCATHDGLLQLSCRDETWQPETDSDSERCSDVVCDAPAIHSRFCRPVPAGWGGGRLGERGEAAGSARAPRMPPHAQSFASISDLRATPHPPRPPLLLPTPLLRCRRG